MFVTGVSRAHKTAPWKVNNSQAIVIVYNSILNLLYLKYSTGLKFLFDPHGMELSVLSL